MLGSRWTPKTPAAVAIELEGVAAAQDERQAPPGAASAPARRSRTPGQLVRGGARHEHCRGAEQRQLQHGAVPVDAVPQPPLAGVAPQCARAAGPGSARSMAGRVRPGTGCARQRLLVGPPCEQVNDDRREEGNQERNAHRGRRCWLCAR